MASDRGSVPLSDLKHYLSETGKIISFMERHSRYLKIATPTRETTSTAARMDLGVSNGLPKIATMKEIGLTAWSMDSAFMSESALHTRETGSLIKPKAVVYRPRYTEIATKASSRVIWSTGKAKNTTEMEIFTKVCLWMANLKELGSTYGAMEVTMKVQKLL